MRVRPSELDNELECSPKPRQVRDLHLKNGEGCRYKEVVFISFESCS